MILTERAPQQQPHATSPAALLSQVKLTSENMVPYIPIFYLFPASAMTGSRPETVWKAPQMNTAESRPADITEGFTSLSGGTVLAALGSYGIWKQAGSFAFSLPNVLRKRRG